MAFRLQTDVLQVDLWALSWFIFPGSCTILKTHARWIMSTSEENEVSPVASKWALAAKADERQTDLHPKCSKAHCPSFQLTYRWLPGFSLSVLLVYQTIGCRIFTAILLHSCLMLNKLYACPFLLFFAQVCFRRWWHYKFFFYINSKAWAEQYLVPIQINKLIFGYCQGFYLLSRRENWSFSISRACEHPISLIQNTVQGSTHRGSWVVWWASLLCVLLHQCTDSCDMQRCCCFNHCSWDEVNTPASLDH